MDRCLFEILVPTIYGDTLKPIRTKHHKEWDKRVQIIAGGLTILSPAKGKWVFKGVTYPEKVIPVRIACTQDQIEEIAWMTMEHYRQKAIMYYKLSSDVRLLYNDNLTNHGQKNSTGNL